MYTSQQSQEQKKKEINKALVKGKKNGFLKNFDERILLRRLAIPLWNIPNQASK
jgi:hypothetical protein